jgi:type III secretion protein J
MPEDPGLGQDTKPSSAAVFLKQKPGYDLDFLMPQVRRLVSNSIEGVEYDNVTVILVDTQAPPTREARMNTEFSEPIPGIKVEAAAVNRFMMYAIGAAAIVGLLALLSAFLTWRVMVMRKRVALATDGEDDN